MSRMEMGLKRVDNMMLLRVREKYDPANRVLKLRVYKSSDMSNRFLELPQISIISHAKYGIARLYRLLRTVSMAMWKVSGRMMVEESAKTLPNWLRKRPKEVSSSMTVLALYSHSSKSSTVHPSLYVARHRVAMV